MASTPAKSSAKSPAGSHIEALASKHAGIDAKLRDEMRRPVPDDATVQSLKKQKLRIKEAIATQ